MTEREGMSSDMNCRSVYLVCVCVCACEVSPSELIYEHLQSSIGVSGWVGMTEIFNRDMQTVR